MILVFGANGLLGSHICSLYPKDTIGATHCDVDISDYRQLDNFITRARPDVVINAAGIVRGRGLRRQYIHEVNSKAPQNMAKICDDLGIRLIQVSTDCVFDGKKGKYTEKDKPNPYDFYGITKHRGEVTYEPHLTVRTSFVGWPDIGQRGLLYWLKSHRKGTEIPGYSGFKWNGLTTVSLASYLIELAYSFKVWGLRHIFGSTVTKYDLLKTVNEVYGWGLRIQDVQYPKKNMTLRTVYSDVPDIPGCWHLREQIEYMKESFDEYEFTC